MTERQCILSHEYFYISHGPATLHTVSGAFLPITKRLCNARRLPDSHTLRLQVVPSLIHLVQSPLQHDGVILGGQTAEELPAATVERGVHILVGFYLTLQVLQHKQNRLESQNKNYLYKLFYIH